MAAMQRVHDFLVFASEAEIVGLWGLAMLLVAIASLWADKRRARNARFDKVGWVPWTTLFMASALMAATLLVLAAKGIIAGK